MNKEERIVQWIKIFVGILYGSYIAYLLHHIAFR